MQAPGRRSGDGQRHPGRQQERAGECGEDPQRGIAVQQRGSSEEADAWQEAGDGAGGGAADVAEAMVFRQLERCQRVDDTAGYPALHHDVAVPPHAGRPSSGFARSFSDSLPLFSAAPIVPPRLTPFRRIDRFDQQDQSKGPPSMAIFGSAVRGQALESRLSGRSP